MIDFAGEPLEPGIVARIRLEHLQRYAICREAARGKRVLAMGSGEGHGSAMLSDTAAQVVGVDRNPAMVFHASRMYGRLPHLTYAVGAWDKLPLADHSIDLAIAFGTLSARDLHTATLHELRRVLAPEGLFLVAWPNAEAPPTLADLDTQLKSFFDQVEFWGQRLAVGSFTFPLDHAAPRTRLRPLTVAEEVITESVPPLDHALSYIAVCSDAPFEPQQLQLASVAMEPAEDLYLQLTRTLQDVEAQRRKDDAVITELVDRLEAARTAQKTTTRLHSVAVARLQDERLEQREFDTRLASVRHEANLSAQALKETQELLQVAHERLETLRSDGQARHQELTALHQEHAAALAAHEALHRDWAAQIQQRDAWLAELHDHVRVQATHLDTLQRGLTDIQGSTSWRLSAPIRALKRSLDAMTGRRGRP